MCYLIMLLISYIKNCSFKDCVWNFCSNCSEFLKESCSSSSTCDNVSAVEFLQCNFQTPKCQSGSNLVCLKSLLYYGRIVTWIKTLLYRRFFTMVEGILLNTSQIITLNKTLFISISCMLIIPSGNVSLTTQGGTYFGSLIRGIVSLILSILQCTSREWHLTLMSHICITIWTCYMVIKLT